MSGLVEVPFTCLTQKIKMLFKINKAVFLMFKLMPPHHKCLLWGLGLVFFFCYSHKMHIWCGFLVIVPHGHLVIESD